MNLSDYQRQQIMLAAFNGTPVTFPSTYYLALFLVPVNDTDTGSSGGEPTGLNYARMPISNNSTDWSVASGVATNLVGYVSNNPSGPWGSVIYAMLTDAPAGGNSWWWGPLQSAVSPSPGHPLSVPPGNFTLSMS